MPWNSPNCLLILSLGVFLVKAVLRFIVVRIVLIIRIVVLLASADDACCKQGAKKKDSSAELHRGQLLSPWNDRERGLVATVQYQ